MSHRPAPPAPRAAKVLTAALAVCGVAAAVVDRVFFDSAPVNWTWIVPLLALLIAGATFQIRFRYRDEVEALDLFEAALAPVLFAVAGWLVVPMVVVANGIEAVLRRNKRLKGTFNVAQWAAAAGVGALVLASLRHGTALSGHNVAALVITLGVVLLMNHLAFTAVVAIVQRHSLRQALAGIRAVIVPGWIVGGGLNLAFALLFVAAYHWSVAAVPLFFVPLVALNWAGAAYAAARADETRLHALHQASSLLVGPVDPLDAVEEFLAHVRGCFECEAAELLLVGDTGQELYRSPQAGDALTPGLAPQLLALERPTRMSADGRDASATWRDCLAAPLSDGTGTVGVLCTYNRTGLEGFEQGELAVLGALADDVVAAVQRSHLVKRLVEERRALRNIIGSASDGIFTLDRDGTVTSWNPALTTITGYRADDVVGRGDLAVLRARDSANADVILERWAESDADLPADLQVLTRAGERRWLSCSYSRVTAPDSSDASLTVIARDVTKEHEVERLREDFVATVSHELRTPLSPIKGWASTLLDLGDKLDRQARREGLQSILRQAQRLERLVVNLLEVSRIEHSGAEPRPEDVAEVSSVARRVVEDFQAAYPDRSIRIDGADRPCWARAKELCVEQIVSNLVSNAVKYSAEPELVEVTVKPALDHIGVIVVDHGCGIPAHELERVFERFHRVRETGTQTGTGLGLYIARQLAEQVGGRVTVTSVVGHGSRFTVELPAAVRVLDVRPPDGMLRLETG
ncbi:MAG: PAS domain S-box protein [Acidimicrobiia bacterium]|nr:PAS domain S-box protein [Acidimicrobiia bacterium]